MYSTGTIDYCFSILFLVSIISKTTLGGTIINDIVINGRPHRIMGTSLTENGVRVDYFAKIPYARPPIGDLRFKYPQEIEGDSWTGIYNSTSQPNTCWQTDAGDFDILNPAANMWISKTSMSEDCLYLTIWVPRNTTGKLPVMVWIYGGGFNSGSSTLELYDGSILASRKNVIVVSLQYRLGPLGFLYLDDKLAPGNQGLMDQHIALKWVKNNIRHFDGDDEKITIFGESAGSASVSFHVLSPLSKNLFKRAIMQSGTAIAPWAIDRKSVAKEKAIQLTSYLKCETSSLEVSNLMNCLMSSNSSTLVNKQFELESFVTKKRMEILRNREINNFSSDGSYFLSIYFKPIYDNVFVPENIRSTSESLPLRNDTDLLMGFNANEGMYFVMYGLNKSLNFFDNGTVRIPNLLDSENPKSLNPSDLILENLLNLRFAYKPLIPLFLYEYRVPSKIMDFKQWNSLQVLSALDQMTGDNLFVCPVVKKASIASEQRNNVYLYNFRHRTAALTFPEWTGAMHGYEIEYVFGMPFSEKFKNLYYTFSSDEAILSDAMMTFWTNFAKFGNPTPEAFNYFQYKVSWLQYNVSDPLSFHLSTPSDNIGYPMKKEDKSHKCKFWSNVLPSIVAQFEQSSPKRAYLLEPIICSQMLIMSLLAFYLLP